MEIIELNADNVRNYKDVLGGDVSENIGREFYRGILARDGDGSEALGAMIWEYRNLEENRDTNAEIIYAGSKSAEVIKALLAEYDQLASDEEVKRTFFELDELSEDEKICFSDDGFELMVKEGRDIVLSISELQALAGHKVKSERVVSFDKIMEIQFMQGVTNCMFHGKKGIVEDLEYVEKDWFDEKSSCCVITDKKVSGMLLVHRFPSGDLMPVLLTALGPDSKADLLNMIFFSAKRAVENYPGDTRVIVRRHNDAVMALTRKLFAGKTGNRVIYGERG